MKPVLVIDVLWHTDESEKKEAAGMDTSVADFDTREATFYHIDSIIPDEWAEGEFCRIFSGGEKFIVPFSYKEVKQRIENGNQ